MVLVGWIAARKSPVMDEPAHLVPGISHWQFGTFDLYRVNLPLVRMVAAIPVLAADAPRVPSLLFDDHGDVTRGNMDDVQVGWYVVSVNYLMGYRHEKTDRPQWSWLQEFTPVDRAGYSIWIYHLTKQDVKAFRQRHRNDPSHARDNEEHG